MIIRQIDMKTALELASQGTEILVMEPTTNDPQEWTDYQPDTLRNMLDGCLFFRREPAMERPDFEAVLPEAEGAKPGGETDRPPEERPAREDANKPPRATRIDTGAGRKKADLDTGKLLALHRAGRSNREIAAELGVSDVAVENCLKRLKGNADGEKTQ